ncbi:hypothetical protein IVB05_37790 [Bradyrhizobium sp. 170]|nr:hypothetical protein IVB05_37790 [Bradyrhizobium sp. 170]
MNLDQLTATQAAADLCAGKITSKALTTAALARAKAKGELNAFITLDEAGAMKAAEAFDAGRKKGSCKPLGGVPVVIKDNIEVAGLPASAGTPAFPASSFRSHLARRANCPSASNSMDPRGAIASCSRLAWRWRRYSAGCHRRRARLCPRR